MIAARKQDPDTLFFQRRLVIEGDTELGLYVKNLTYRCLFRFLRALQACFDKIRHLQQHDAQCFRHLRAVRSAATRKRSWFTICVKMV
jgi:predicted lipid carrier protein YhbT